MTEKTIRLNLYKLIAKTAGFNNIGLYYPLLDDAAKTHNVSIALLVRKIESGQHGKDYRFL